MRKLTLFFLALFIIFTIQPATAVQAAAVPNHNNIIYLYGEDSELYKKQLSITNNQVGTLAPSYFDLDSNGNLIVKIDKSFVSYAHQNGYRITPFVSNHWDYLTGAKAMENREELARQITQAVLQNNLDGVNIDIENLTPKEKDAQTEFLQLLTDQLRPYGKTVSIAVAPAQADTAWGWTGSYDFEAIGKIVDTVFIMAYDQHYLGGSPGPQGGYEWVKNSVRYLSEKIPPEKLVLGLAFYGRYWSDDVHGAAVSYNGAQNLIEKHGAAVQWHNVHQTPYAVFQDQTTGTNYEVWYDNAKSLQKKISLVQEFGLKGWGAWRLGQEDPDLWQGLSSPAIGDKLASQAARFLGYKITNFSSAAFVSHVFKQEGYSVPSNLNSLSKQGNLITKESELQPGDVLFFGTSRSNLIATGIYTGDGKFIIAYKPYAKIKELSLLSSEAQKYYLGAKRIAN